MLFQAAQKVASFRCDLLQDEAGKGSNSLTDAYFLRPEAQNTSKFRETDTGNFAGGSQKFRLFRISREFCKC